MFTVIWLRISRAPGWAAQRYLAAISATASLFCLGDLVRVLSFSDTIARLGFGLAIASGCAHGMLWLLWLAANHQRSLSRLEFWACVSGIGLVVLSLVPGLVGDSSLNSIPCDWMGAVYRTPEITVIGALSVICFAALLGWTGWSTLRLGDEQRIKWGLAAMTVLISAAVHDTLVCARVVGPPFLADVCFFVVIVGIGLSELQRFVFDARRLEELSNDLEKQVAERSEQLSRMQVSLARAEKLVALGQLAAGVAHEVNNPAAVVSSNLQFAFSTLENEQRLSDEVKSSLTDSMLATKRIAKIVRQLLDAGSNAGNEVATVLPCDPGLAIGRAMARVRQTFGKSFSIDVNIGKDTKVRADIAILEQVLYNLLQNAAHAVRVRGQAGCVVVSTRRADKHVVIEIADNGDGIPADLQHRLFEPFFTTKEFGQGTGLGLAVSLGLMRAQQGDLRLARSGSAGSVFELVLVWSPDDTSSLHIPSAVVAYGNLRLLIVDDDRQIRDSLRRALGKMFRIEVAAGVEEALGYISQSKDELDAVLCDILMPNGGGARVYEEICRMSPKLAQRTLFMTGGATSAEAQAFLKAHSERVLLKPLNQTRLRESLLAMIRDRAGESE